MNKYLASLIVVGSLVSNVSYSATSLDNKVEAALLTSVTAPIFLLGIAGLGATVAGDMPLVERVSLGTISGSLAVSGACCLYWAYRNYQRAEKWRIQQELKQAKQVQPSKM